MIKLNITKTDIKKSIDALVSDKGVLCTSCPIAQALKRRFKGEYVITHTKGGKNLYGQSREPGKAPRIRFIFGTAAVDFVKKFDEGAPVGIFDVNPVTLTVLKVNEPKGSAKLCHLKNSIS